MTRAPVPRGDLRTFDEATRRQTTTERRFEFAPEAILCAATSSMLETADECIRSLGEAGVNSVLLKGLAFDGTLYPAQGTRPTSDVDLLVRLEHRRLALVFSIDSGSNRGPSHQGSTTPTTTRSPGPGTASKSIFTARSRPLRVVGLTTTHSGERSYPCPPPGRPRVMLASRHAAIFQALHMAIDHFHVPAIYLVDLARLLPTAAEVRATAAIARAWRVYRPFATALALTANFLPTWALRGAIPVPRPPMPRILHTNGAALPLPRGQQLWRKLMHFDRVDIAVRYLAVQTERNVREWIERRWYLRSARERLGL